MRIWYGMERICFGFGDGSLIEWTDGAVVCGCFFVALLFFVYVLADLALAFLVLASSSSSCCLYPLALWRVVV